MFGCIYIVSILIEDLREDWTCLTELSSLNKVIIIIIIIIITIIIVIVIILAHQIVFPAFFTHFNKAYIVSYVSLYKR